MSKYRITISKSAYNDAFIPLRDDWHRYLVVFGGAGSGKSYSIGEIIIERMLKEKQYNLLVVRNTGRSNRDSTFALLNQIINKWNLNQLFTINSSDLRIKCLNGNEIIFSGLDDVEKLKSVTFSKGELSSIWVEEASEILEADFNQLDIRLRGKTTQKQIILTFNPIDINHWLKKRFIDVTDDRVSIHHSTYLDNRFLDDDYRRLLESYKDTDPYYYEVYCLGNWGVLGETIFDAQAINNRLKCLEQFVARGHFSFDRQMNWVWQDNYTGNIKIYEKPQPGHKYVIGGDTASGVGSDYSICQVIDAATGKQVAVLKDKMDSDLYAKQCYCLGKYYNDALISIEVNFDIYPIKKLEELGYTNQYVREQQDSFTGGIKKAFGFRTDSYSRPRMLSHLVEIVREHTDLFNDRDTLEEMLTFIRNDKGRAEAQEGAHDDLVMAMAIAHESASQVLFYNETKPQYDEDLEIYEWGM